MATEYFQASKDIYAKVFELIDRNHLGLFIVRDEISIMFRSTATKVAGQKKMGKVTKVSAKTRAYAGRNYLLEIELAQDVWEELTSLQQEALLDHLLTSCVCEENAKTGAIHLSILPPDIAAFRENVDRYGLWFPSERELDESALRFKVVRPDNMDASVSVTLRYANEHPRDVGEV